MDKETKRVGRPTEDLYEKYEIDDHKEVILSMLRKGATDGQISLYLNISEVTYYKIKGEYVVFAELIKEGRHKSVAMVENALFKRATGYEFEEKTTEVKINADGVGTTTYIKKTNKHIAPDMGAMAFYLKNRASEDWKDKQDHKHSFEDDGSELVLIVKGSKSNLLAPDKI